MTTAQQRKDTFVRLARQQGKPDSVGIKWFEDNEKSMDDFSARLKKPARPKNAKTNSVLNNLPIYFWPCLIISVTCFLMLIF